MNSTRFLRFGKHVVNPSLITHLEILADGASRVYFFGVADSVRLDAEPTTALVAALVPAGE